jgi:hypothetical protein
MTMQASPAAWLAQPAWGAACRDVCPAVEPRLPESLRRGRAPVEHRQDWCQAGPAWLTHGES